MPRLTSKSTSVLGIIPGVIFLFLSGVGFDKCRLHGTYFSINCFSALVFAALGFGLFLWGVIGSRDIWIIDVKQRTIKYFSMALFYIVKDKTFYFDDIKSINVIERSHILLNKVGFEDHCIEIILKNGECERQGLFNGKAAEELSGTLFFYLNEQGGISE
jgi:hypothetical protein